MSDCIPTVFSSRICEKGTKGCLIHHHPLIDGELITVLDDSPCAKTKPKHMLKMFYQDGQCYKQVKKYCGSFCLGIYWAECTDNGEEIKNV